jgi:hypothetical protein
MNKISYNRFVLYQIQEVALRVLALLACGTPEQRRKLVEVTILSPHGLRYQSFCDHSRNFASVSFEGFVRNV